MLSFEKQGFSITRSRKSSTRDSRPSKPVRAGQGFKKSGSEVSHYLKKLFKKLQLNSIERERQREYFEGYFFTLYI